MRLTESLRQDLRIAVRVLNKGRGATALCIVSVALGIGLTTGIFSTCDAVFLRPLALERPDEVFEAASRGDDGQELLYGWPDYEDIVKATAGLAEVAAYQRRGAMLARAEERELILATPASRNYFSLLGVRAALGRASVEPEGGQPAVVLGHRLWQGRFGGDPGIVGKRVMLGRAAFVVAGVLPAEFTGLSRGVANDVWVSMDDWFDALGHREERQDRFGQVELVARLAPGVNPQRVAAQFDAAIRGAGKHKPAPPNLAGTVLEASYAPGWKAGLLVGGGMLLVLALVLFVACANVAQLRLAQAETRKKELGIRMALGGSPGRVARQLLIETGLLSLAGAVFGVLFARFLMEKAAEFLAAGRMWLDYGIRLDSRVLIFTLAAVVASVLVSGLAPVRHAVRLNVIEVLKSDQGVAGARSHWHKKALIVGQVAVSVALFGLAVLFYQSFRNAAAVRPGFDPQKKLLVLTVSPGQPTPAPAWCEQATHRLSGLPGARGATFARRLPLSGSGGGMTARVEIPGLAPLGVRLNHVAGNYFSLMGTRVLAGRGIDTNDRQGTPLAVVVSQQFARHVFGNRNPVGEWLSVEGKKRQVVGVAEDGPSNDIHEPPEPYLYLPYAQEPPDDITLIVETAVEPATLAQAARRELRRFDPGVTVYGLTTLHQHMHEALSGDRTMATLSTGLGLLSFLLTAAGLFGVIQFAVNGRTREIGLRMSLGAQAGTIQKMVLAESLRMAAWGIPIGLLLLVTGSWWARSMVLGVSPLDPLTYVSSVAAAVIVALSAAWLPARRATRVDPMASLRSE